MKKKYYSLLIISFTLIGLTIITPVALATTQKSYLLTYILGTQNDNQGFGNSFESTSQALEILSDYSSLDGNVDSGATQLYLRNQIQSMFDLNDINIYDLYYILKSLDILNSSAEEVHPSMKSNIIQFLEDISQTGGGFSPTNATGSSSTMVSTYYAIQAYSILDDSFAVSEIHKTYTKDCLDSNGGYKGNISLSSTSLTNTYYAILIMNKTDALNELENIPDTISYLDNFYISLSSDINNYGGYLPDGTADYALLSSTYYCVAALNLISQSSLNETITRSWIYDRQNFQDGGFVDNIIGNNQKSSSISCSYFAVEALALLEGKLDSEVWKVEFNYIILIVLFIILGVVVLATAYIRKRRRI